MSSIDYKEKEPCSNDKRKHCVICIDEVSDDNDTSTNEHAEHKKAKGLTNHDIIYIDEDFDDDVHSNSTKVQTKRKRAKAMTNHDIIYIDGVSDNLAHSISTNEQTGSKKAELIEEEGLIWNRLQRILDNKECKDEPSGPSQEENRLLSRVTEFGITPYKFEVPLGNGVSDCVGHDMNNRLCVVEAKCLFRKKSNHDRRAKVVEQTMSYAIFLSQETKSDVAAYSFDDQNGMIALQSFGVLKYDKVKDRDPRGKDVANKFTNKKSTPKQNAKFDKRSAQSWYTPKDLRGGR